MVPLLKKKDAPYNLHLFVDKINATPGDVAKTIAEVAKSVDGALLVLNKSNKVRSAILRSTAQLGPANTAV